jgi:predicted ATPase
MQSKMQRRLIPYVGRQEERKFLTDCLKEALDGHGGNIFVCGEPGIGKTRLTLTVLDELESALGCFVLKGKGHQREKPLAYEPFVEAIRSLCRMKRFAPKEFEQLLGPYRSYFYLLFPEIGQEAGFLPYGVSPEGSLQESQAKYALFEGVLQLFLSLSDQQPFVLFLDDLHWMDEASLELFCSTLLAR